MATGMTDNRQLAENIRRLRNSKGWNQEQLAKSAGYSLATIRSLEAGRSVPKVDTLQMVAKALDVTIYKLLKPINIPQAVRFRSLKKLRTRNDILAEAGGWLENVRELEYLLKKDLSDSKLTDAFKGVSAIHDPLKKAKKAAAELRKLWNLDEDEPIRNICGLMENNGVKVFSLAKDSEGFFGLSVGMQDGGPAIVVNTWDRLPVERWIFSAVHELGHLVMHLESFEVGASEEIAAQENEANHFAAHFLMPEKAFKKELSSLSGLPWVKSVLVLKRIFKVSYLTVLRRFIEMGMYDNKVYPQFYTRYKTMTGKDLKGHREPSPLEAQEYSSSYGEPEPDKLSPSDFPDNYLLRLVKEALIDREVININKAAHLLGMKTFEVRKLIDGWLPSTGD